MATEFSYKARNKSGKIIQGFIEANDRKRAESILRRRNLYPVSIVDASDDMNGEQKILGSFIIRNAEGQIAINLGEKKASVDPGSGYSGRPAAFEEFWLHDKEN